MKILGERTFNPYIEKVPELQMAKVKDAFGRAEIKYKAGGKAAAPKPAAAAPVPAKKVSKAICPGLTI
jgi:cytoskeleton-associated protein 5